MGVLAPVYANSQNFAQPPIYTRKNMLAHMSAKKQLKTQTRDEQDLLEILDLELFGVKTLVSILIEPSLANVVLLDSFLV
jgi:hypothetical protein